MRLFRLNKERLELLRDEILCIPEFAKLLLLGNEDIKSEQYFIFIYIYCDYTSPYFAYDDNTRLEKAIYESGLPKTWKPDKLIQDAINKYVSIRDTPTIKSLKAYSQGLELSNKVIKGITDKMVKILEALDKIDLDTLIDPKDIEVFSMRQKMVRDDLSYLLSLMPKIQDSTNTCNTLLKKAIKDDFEEKKASGDKKIGNRAIPVRE